jgi:hypothetical protein
VIVDIQDIQNPKLIKSKMVLEKTKEFHNMVNNLMLAYSKELDQLYYSDDGLI